MPRVMVPPTPGILCALGQLISDLRHDFVETHVIAYEAMTEAEASARIRRLTDRADTHLDHDGVAGKIARWKCASICATAASPLSCQSRSIP